MKCEHCNEEIALSSVCPYCGRRVSGAREEARRESEESRGEAKESGGPRGRFRGILDRDDGSSRPGGASPGSAAGTGAPLWLRFLLNGRVPSWAKIVPLAALFYVLSPVDAIPGALVPFLGWFDDAVVLYLAWQWMASQLKRHG